MSTLRGQSNLGPSAEDLPANELAAAQTAQHPALYVAHRMSSCLQHARVRGLITDIIQMSLDQNVQLLVDYVGGCERIRKTPLPFAYAVHLRRALVIYCLTLPFALVESFGWFTIFDVLFVTYTFFGIEEIGVEIEGPFGDDANDLPMQDLCETIQNNIYALAGLSRTEREIMPEGL
jgi:putative membrane protein